MTNDSTSRIETAFQVRSFIQNLQYALNSGAKIIFQEKRIVDDNRDERFTNRYTMNALFPDENPVEALRRELLSLTVGDYMRTVKDLRFPNRSEMREFGKTYSCGKDVYIKVRVELFSNYGNATTFVMSFHFAEKLFTSEMFPYRKSC